MHHREPQFFPPIFFPYADALSLSAHTMKRHGMPAKRHKIARLYAPKNAPLQFKSGCHLQKEGHDESHVLLFGFRSRCSLHPKGIEHTRGK